MDFTRIERIGDEHGPSPDNQGDSNIVGRRTWLQWNLRTLFAVTAGAALLLNQYRKRHIAAPRASWGRFVTYAGSAEKMPLRHRGYMTDVLLEFHDNLEVSRLNVSDIVEDAEYQKRVCAHIEDVLRKMREAEHDFQVHDDVRELSVLLRTAHLHHPEHDRFSEKMRATMRQKLPPIIDSYVKRNRDSVFDALHILLPLHHAGLTIDDVYAGTSDFKGLMRRLAAKEIDQAQKDPQKQYRTVELCALIEEVAGVDMRGKVPEVTMKTLAQRELHRYAENLDFMWGMQSTPPPGALHDLFLTPNVIARYADVDEKDPYYVEAKNKTLRELRHSSSPHILRRLLESGKGY